VSALISSLLEGNLSTEALAKVNVSPGVCVPSIKADRWIKKMALEHGMIEPFEDRQVRQGVISYGLSSYGYDIRVADEFKVFTNINSTGRGSEELRRALVRGHQGGRLHHPAEFVRAGQDRWSTSASRATC
jgi:hypothetical protein